MSNHKSVRANVKLLVETFPDLAEDYSRLNVAYWCLFDGCEKIDDLVGATSAETIRRNFQKLVEMGVLPVPQRILEKRKEKELEYQSEFAALG